VSSGQVVSKIEPLTTPSLAGEHIDNRRRWGDQRPPRCRIHFAFVDALYVQAIGHSFSEML